MLLIDNTTYLLLTDTHSNSSLAIGAGSLQYYSESSVVVAKEHFITYKSIKTRRPPSRILSLGLVILKS